MARNQEKAQHALNRYIDGKREELEGPKATRPYLASLCDTVPECEKWRMEIVREVGKKVSMIQNEGLAEHKIRDLNDQINKLLREKHHWEKRIKELGGPDYAKSAPRIDDDTSLEVVPGGKGGGYRYFGAAKNLPGVRELFVREPVSRPKRTRAQIAKSVDADYYGYRDDDDGELERLEAEAEARAREDMIKRWKAEKGAAAVDDDDLAIPRTSAAGNESDSVYLAHVPLPSEADIEKAILERRKRELMAKYLGGSGAS